MIKSILNFFSNKEKEIYILTSLSTFAGGSKFKDEKYWNCGQKFIAYVDCDTNQVYKTDGMISWQTKDKTKHPFEFEPKTIYKVKVKYTQKNEYLVFPLMEVTDSFAKNKQLLSLVNELLIIDSVCNIEFNEKDKYAVGELNWLGEEIFVDFYDVPDINSVKQAFSHLKEMVKNAYSWDSKLRLFIAEQTLGTVNDWLAKGSEHSKITTHILKNDQIIDNIDIKSNGDFLIMYLLKTYNFMISVEGNVNGELKKAYLE